MTISKLFLPLFCALFFSLTANAAISPSALLGDPVNKYKLTATEKMKVLQMQRFAKMTLGDYEKLKGHRLNFFEKLSFKTSKRRINKILTRYSYGDGPTVVQKIGWLCKGILLGPIALLIGYLFLKDEERELIKWIWFGFAGWLIILGIILFV